METLNAYRDHGQPAFRLENDLEKSREVFDKFGVLDIDLKKVAQQLVEEGIQKFNDPSDKLMDELNERLKQPHQRPVDNRVAP